MSPKSNVGTIVPYDDLDETAKHLIDAANAGRNLAYCPFSKFPVGAAVAWDDSDITDNGCNVENSAYGECVCAERTAIFKGVTQGKRLLTAIAIVAENTSSADFVSPCGACRQVIYEFGTKVDIYLSKPSTLHGEVLVTSIETMLPLGFRLK